MTIDFALAHAADGDPRSLVEACAARLDDTTGHDLGFVYVTDPLAYAFPEIVADLGSRTEIANWVGTVGLGVCATGTEYFGRPALVVLTGRFGDDGYRMVSSLTAPGEVASVADARFSAGLGVVHGDPRNPEIAEIVSALARDRGSYLVGGLTAANGTFPQVAGGVTEGGVSGVLLDGDLDVAVGLTQGCSPIGSTHQVTHGAGNVLVTLDGRPACEVLLEDVGVAEGADPRPWLANIHAALPIAGSDTGDYLVRNLVAIDPAQGLVVTAAETVDGDWVLFVRRDAESASKDLRRMLQGLGSRVTATPRAGLYFSCVARGPNLFSDKAHELKAIREAFGDIPIAGFFGNGEISNDRVYAYTGVLTLFV